MLRQYVTKKKLPDSPGIYVFKKGSKILYIGKATSLRDRVKSYFSNDLIHTRGRLLVDMVTQATTLSFIKTDSVLEAFLLEVEEIKKHLPYYNTKEKDNKSFNYVVITDENFPRVLVVRGRNLEKDTLDFECKYRFGPYPHGGELKEAMRLIRKIFPFRDTCVPCEEQDPRSLPDGLTFAKCRPCFNRSIGLCPGVCSGEMNKKEYGRQIQHIKLFFEGKKSELMKLLKKEMNAYSKEMRFEEAGEIKHTIASLMHIQDVSMMKRKNIGPEIPRDEQDVGYNEGYQERVRIEAYDIAHLSGTDMVGVMAVMLGGEFDKASYRTFTVRSVKGSNDVGALREIIGRRMNHPEWTFPDIIVVDGGKVQLAAAREVIDLSRESMELAGRSVPAVVAVVKDDRHKAREILAEGEGEALARKYGKEIIQLNAESHRFAILTHRKKRTASRGLRKFKKTGQK